MKRLLSSRGLGIMQKSVCVSLWGNNYTNSAAWGRPKGYEGSIQKSECFWDEMFEKLGTSNTNETSWKWRGAYKEQE